MSDQASFPRDVKYNLPSDLSQDELNSFPAYKNWISGLSKALSAQHSPDHPYNGNPYKLRSITVQALDRFGGNRLGFVKLKADVSTDDGERFPGSVFMRGGSVAMLFILTPELSANEEIGGESGEERVILTVQPRIPAGTLNFTEIPAGMLDDSGTFSGAAAKEIEEETGLRIQEDELVEMTDLAFSGRGNSSQVEHEEGHDEVLQNAIYPSPGGSDEFIPIFLVRKTMKIEDIEKLQGRLTGLRDHGEKISLRVVTLKDVWRVAGRDAKTLSALYLYEALKREGKL